MYYAIACRESCHDVIVLNEPLIQEFKFWLSHTDAFNGYAIQRKFSAHAVVYSDASDTGLGGFSALIGTRECVGHWDQFDAAQSSTYKELKAILFVSTILF